MTSPFILWMRRPIAHNVKKMNSIPALFQIKHWLWHAPQALRRETGLAGGCGELSYALRAGWRVYLYCAERDSENLGIDI